MKFVQPPTLPCSHQSEDEVSDRDLPELAPIEDYERIKCSQVKSNQNNAGDPEEDLGSKLSPLGSTSSLQDLVEASSARASVDPNSQNSTWLEKERQKKVSSDSNKSKQNVSKSSMEKDQTKCMPPTNFKAEEEEEIGEELEKVEHYLESPAKDIDENNDDEEEKQQYTAVCELHMKTNTQSGLDHNKPKLSPTHSLVSSSSGSYSVNNTENGKRSELPDKPLQKESSEKPTQVQVSTRGSPSELPEPEIAKQELTPVQDLPDYSCQIHVSKEMSPIDLPETAKCKQELTPVQDLPEQPSQIIMSKEKCPPELPETAKCKQELTPVHDLPEYPSQIQVSKEKSPIDLPETAKCKQELTPVRELSEKPSQIHMTQAEIVEPPNLPETASEKQELTPVKELPEKHSKVKISSRESSQIPSETAKRKQELTLDLDLDAPPQMVHKDIISPTSDESSENRYEIFMCRRGNLDVPKIIFLLSLYYVKVNFSIESSTQCVYQNFCKG